MGKIEFEGEVEPWDKLAEQLLRTQQVDVSAEGLVKVLDVTAYLLLLNLGAVADQLLDDGVLQTRLFVVGGCL